MFSYPAEPTANSVIIVIIIYVAVIVVAIGMLSVILPSKFILLCKELACYLCIFNCNVAIYCCHTRYCNKDKKTASGLPFSYGYTCDLLLLTS